MPTSPKEPTPRRGPEKKVDPFDGVIGPGRGRPPAVPDDKTAAAASEPSDEAIAVASESGEPDRTDLPCAQATRLILKKREMSIRMLAAMSGINQSHLSRALRGSEGRYLSPETARAIGSALGRPAGFFPEERDAAVREAFGEYLKHNTELREQLYDLISSDRRWQLQVRESD